MDENLVADPAQRVNYQVLKNKYGGWNYANFEAAIKKAQRPSELDELRIAAKYFLGPEDAMKADEANHQRLNELSDRLISFGDFMRAYKNAEAGFMAMRDRCVKAGNNWVCASYMSQVEFFINSQAKDTSTGGRGPLNDMLGKVREGYETVKIIEQKWKEYKEKGEKEKLPGFEEEEIKDIFKGFLAKEIGQDRFWASMDIRSEVEGKPIITPAKKKELIDLWAKHGIMLPAQKHITKPEVIMPKPPATPMEPVPLEEMRQVIKKEEDLEKRIEELRKKKELEKQREKERMEKEWQKLPKPETRPEKPAPSPPSPPAPSPELDLMKDEIEKRIAEMMRRKRAGEGQAGEPAAKYITPKILDRKEIAHLSKDIEDNCVPLGYVNLYSLFPKSRFGTDTGILYDCRNVDSSKLKRDTIARGESDIIIATSSKPYRIKFYPDLKEIIIGELQAGEPAARYDAKKKDLNAPMTTLLQVTGTESRYSGSQYIKTPVIVSVEQDQYAKYLIYRRGAGKEASTSFHAKTFTNMYVLRYQGAFGYTVELGFTDEKNNAIKIMLDPALGKIINGIVFENERKIAEFDVDEASFRKAEQFARENKVIKEMRGGYEQLHELQNKNKIKESGNGYELSDEEYNRAKKLNFDELIKLNICPECMHKMVSGKCLLHGTRDQILSYYSKYTIKETDDEIIQQIKNEQGNLKGLKCTTIKSFHKPGYTVVVMKPYQEGQGLGSMGSTSLYDINFKEESSAKRLEAKLKLLFESERDVVCNTLYDKDVNLNYLVGDAYNIQDITRIKQAALSGKKTIWVNDKGREGLILASKYGKDWWQKATQCDIQRIAVYESSGKYSTAEKARNIQMQEKKKPDGYKDSLAMRLFGKKYFDLDSEKKKAIDDRLRNVGLKGERIPAT